MNNWRGPESRPFGPLTREAQGRLAIAMYDNPGSGLSVEAEDRGIKREDYVSAKLDALATTGCLPETSPDLIRQIEQIEALRQSVRNADLPDTDENERDLSYRIKELKQEDDETRIEIAEFYLEARSKLFAKITDGVASGSLPHGFDLGQINVGDRPGLSAPWEGATLDEERLATSPDPIPLTNAGYQNLRHEVYKFLGVEAPDSADFAYDIEEQGPGAIVILHARVVTATNVPGVFLVEDRERLDIGDQDADIIAFSLHDASVPEAISV
jgi:hypothetical protein